MLRAIALGLAFGALLAANDARSETIHVTSRNTNADCESFGEGIVGRWTLERAATGWIVGHDGMRWPLGDLPLFTRGHGVIVTATLPSIEPPRLVLVAAKWGCRWEGSR